MTAEQIIEKAVGEWHNEMDPDLGEYVLWALRGRLDYTLGDTITIDAGGTVGRLERLTVWRGDNQDVHLAGEECDHIVTINHVDDDGPCGVLYRVVTP